jgi:hypothetical protein
MPMRLNQRLLKKKPRKNKKRIVKRLDKRGVASLYFYFPGVLPADKSFINWVKLGLLELIINIALSIGAKIAQTMII